MASKLSYYLSMLQRLRPRQASPKIWNYAKYRILPKRPIVACRRYTPQIIGLSVTKRCNLNCGYCNAAKMLHEGKSDWIEAEATLEKVQRLFERPLCRNCLLVDLLGGEPLLVKDLDKIVAFLTHTGRLTNTSTNGLLLASRIKDLKRAGISRINVSLYEANRSVLDRDLCAINSVFPVHTSIVLLRSQVERDPERLLETVRFAKEQGCLSMRFWMYRPMGLDPRSDEVLQDSNPAYLEFRRRVDEAFPNFCLWPAVVQAGRVCKSCSQLWQRITCDMLGNMTPCCGIDEVLSGSEGNLFQSDADVVFNHPRLVAMRKQLLDPNAEPPGPCAHCNLLGETGW